MHTVLCRRILGAAAVAALACATSIGAGPLPAESSTKAIEADIAHLGTLVDMQKASPNNKSLPGMMKATAMLIAMEAQDNLDVARKDADKMAALRAAALKVAEAVAKKDMDGAAKAVAALKNVAADPKADKNPLKLDTMNKIDLHDIMNLYAKPKGGGMNMQDDIRAMKKDGVKDVKLAEIIGVRTAAIAKYSMDLPPAFGGKKTKAAWEGWTKDMKTQAIELATEASKGSKADPAKLKKVVLALDASCVNCHNVFRDD